MNIGTILPYKNDDLVCFKIIPDLDQMSAKDYEADVRMQVNTSYVRTMWNCFDEANGIWIKTLTRRKVLICILRKRVYGRGEQAELYLKTLVA
ncbi:MAG: hypothetical protein ACLVJO_15365 [[Clostridium] scindens]